MTKTRRKRNGVRRPNRSIRKQSVRLAEKLRPMVTSLSLREIDTLARASCTRTLRCRRFWPRASNQRWPSWSGSRNSRRKSTLSWRFRPRKIPTRRTPSPWETT
uniref:(northern house mosquito) hypothetical protein n=1 Tax=Culex pipiens TaxID=7175 RepID=A0A8D8L4Z1_CULPI